VLGDAEQQDWQKLTEAGVLCLEGDKQQGDQGDAKERDGIPAVFDSGKVSPFPELKPDVPGGLMRTGLSAGGWVGGWVAGCARCQQECHT
jgi:hypothetical protein